MDQGTDSLDVERIQFAGRALASDFDGNADTVDKIKRAVFGADQIFKKEDAGIGLSLMDSEAHTFETLELPLWVCSLQQITLLSAKFRGIT